MGSVGIRSLPQFLMDNWDPILQVLHHFLKGGSGDHNVQPARNASFHVMSGDRASTLPILRTGTADPSSRVLDGILIETTGLADPGRSVKRRSVVKRRGVCGNLSANSVETRGEMGPVFFFGGDPTLYERSGNFEGFPL